MTIPKFWAALIDRSFPDSANECEAIASASIRDSTSHDPEDLRIGELPTKNSHLDKTSETPDDPSLELQHCAIVRTGRRENSKFDRRLL